MGTITTGIGLISGIDTATLIDNLIALEARGKIGLQARLVSLQAQKTALLDINARLLNFKNIARSFRLDSIFKSALASSSNSDILTATASAKSLPGTFTFIVKQLVATSQKLSAGFADTDTTPLGLASLSFEFGKGTLSTDTELANLNGGAGVARGKITIIDTIGTTTVDLTDVTSLNEVLDRINSSGANVTAAVEGDHLVVTENSAGSLNIANAIGYTTATDLGIVGSGVGGTLTGTDINTISGSTALRSLNDGNGVIIRNNVPDLRITARDGTKFDIDLGRIDAPIDNDTLLADLNNGAGVTISDDDTNPEFKFIARDLTEYEVDLTGITTVGGLISRVNLETGGHIQISIHADGDKFTVTDTVGGAGNLKVLGAGTNTTQTAEDLGILNETGAAANSFDGQLIPNSVQDARAVTLQDVIDRINNAKDESDVANGGRIVASIAADGVSLLITDTTPATVNLIIEGFSTDLSRPNAARDLGILTPAPGVGRSTVDGNRLIAGLNSVLLSNLNGGSGVGFATGNSTLTGATLLSDLFNGQGITTNNNAASPDIFVQDRQGDTFQIEVDGLVTVQDLIDAWNTATGGDVTLSINGQTLQADSNVGGPNNFQIFDLNGALVATQLGIVADIPNGGGNTVVGNDTMPLARTEISITNRAGTATTVDLSAARSVLDVINTINNAGAGVTASLNATGNGLRLDDTTGSTANNLVVVDVGTGTLAADLDISRNVAADTIIGTNLQVSYVSEATLLSDLNYGRGVGTGVFRITDGYGKSAKVNIGSDSLTLFDIIQEINSRGLAIKARVNNNGDGLLLEHDPDNASPPETGEPFVAIKVETLSGTTAVDLNIFGEADAVGEDIDGSYERVVTLVVSDSLSDVVGKINDAGIPVSASIINTGSGATPFHLNFSSNITGRLGELIIDSGAVDLGLTTLSDGRDAKVFFGSDDPSQAFLITSSSNSISDVVPGVTIDLVSASDDPVTVTVTRDTQKIEDAVFQLVTTFNDAIGRINDYDSFDVDTEQRGPLLGNSTTARVRGALFRVVQGPARGVETQYQRLSQVGISVGAKGVLAFDKDKFREAYENDPVAVENLFAAFKGSTTTTKEIAPGVTVNVTEQTFTVLGFGDLFDQLLDGLTNSIDGAVTLADQVFQDQIDLTNKRIEAFDVRLDARRARLERQFVAMETALAQLQAMNNALLSLSGNLALAQSLAIRR